MSEQVSPAGVDRIAIRCDHWHVKDAGITSIIDHTFHKLLRGARVSELDVVLCNTSRLIMPWQVNQGKFSPWKFSICGHVYEPAFLWQGWLLCGHRSLCLMTPQWARVALCFFGGEPVSSNRRPGILRRMRPGPVLVAMLTWSGGTVDLLETGCTPDYCSAYM